MRKIKNDLFKIAYRLRKIDKGYFIVFNKLKNRFEVHNKNQLGNSLCFCCDKNYLNCEVLTKANVTNARNSKVLFKEIEKNNLKIQKQREDDLINKHMQNFKSYLEYANNKKSDCDFSNFNLTKWL